MTSLSLYWKALRILVSRVCESCRLPIQVMISEGSARSNSDRVICLDVTRAV